MSLGAPVLASGGGEPAVISIRNLSKSFGGSRPALHRFALDLRRGEIHALVGANGSGKSTVVKLLCGYHSPDDGAAFEVRGAPVPMPVAPGALDRLGVQFVHQDLALAPTISVTDNMRITDFRLRRWGTINWAATDAEVERTLSDFGVSARAKDEVRELKLSERALLAIVRAFTRANSDASVLILDEPTTPLGVADARRVLDLMKTFARRGTAVLFISHRLEEVEEVADTVTVLRDGECVARLARGNYGQSDLVDAIVGGSGVHLGPERQEKSRAPEGAAKATVAAKGLVGHTARGFTATMRGQEIVGLTGLPGSGFEEVPDFLAGVAAAQAGELRLDEELLSVRSPKIRDFRKRGIAYVPSDRLANAVAASLTTRENVTLPQLARFRSGARIAHRKEVDAARLLLRRFRVDPPEPEMLLSSLSGGNQQKAVVGRWLDIKPKVLVLQEPTHAVDVRARQEIYGELRALASSGAVVILASIEYGDLAEVCDRVFVFRGGVAKELRREEITEAGILRACYATDDAQRQRD